MSLLRLVAAVAATLVLSHAAPAAAGTPISAELKETVSSDSSVTYLDLGRLLVADLKPDGTGTDKSGLDKIRHVGGPSDAATVGDIHLSDVHRIDLPGKKGKRALMLFDFGDADDAVQSITILALFDMTARPQLLDTIDVGQDRFTSFSEPYLIQLSADASATFTHSWHLNAGEEYVLTSIVGVWDDKLHDVYSVSMLNLQACSIVERNTLSFFKVKAKPAFDATLTVESKKGDCDAPETTGPMKTEHYKVKFTWDEKARTLKPDSDIFHNRPVSEDEEQQ